MFVSYLVNKVDRNKDEIQILNCSNKKEQLWKLLQNTASKYKDELEQKKELQNLELVEDKHNDIIIIKGTLVTEIPGIIWNSTEYVDLTLITFTIKETNDTVFVSKSIEPSLFSELQNKLLQRRKVLETDFS